MADDTILVRTARQAKIVGGSFAERGEFPYQVSLSYHDEFFCGGSILSTMLILTAAHCVKYKRPSRLKVTTGVYDRSVSSGSEQIRTARYIYMHENYVWETDVNDIAIIVLNAPLQYSAHVQNISLPRESEEFEGYATVTGWGRTKEKGEITNILRKVRLPLVSNEECSKSYRKVRMKVTDNMLCAGESERDACQGDSGGPMVCERTGLQRSSSSSLFLCGVISHGLGCGRAGFPGICTKVSNYIDWIEDTQQTIIARGKCRTDHFYCSSAGCIPRTFLCDLESDCTDGEDEKDCIYKTNCHRNQFRCNNGRCIKSEYTCDDMDDCGDRSDEDKCPTVNKTCGGGQHQCGTGGRCIPTEWKCDTEHDCDDGSDEENCPDGVGSPDNEIDNDGSSSSVKPGERLNKTMTTTTPAPCSVDQFYCSRDYRCIPSRWRCDGDRDCRSGIDEIGCFNDDNNNNNNNVSSTTTTSRPRSTRATTTQRATTYGIPNWNSIFTTSSSITSTPTAMSSSSSSTTTTEATIEVGSNGGDVLPTTTTTTFTTSSIMGNDTGICSRTQFLCDNGQCILDVFQCDFDDDCGDGSDERNCSLIEPLKPTCSAYFWQCANGECIYHRFHCDDDFDCKDKSDELNCEENNSEENYIISTSSSSAGGGSSRSRRRRRRKGRSNSRGG